MKSQLTLQSRRLLEYALPLAGQDIPAPELNKAAAGVGQYVASFSRRVHEVRKYMQSIGSDFVLSKDEHVGRQRNTFYKLITVNTALSKIEG